MIKRYFILLIGIVVAQVSLAQRNMEVVNIENEAVRAFMADDTYLFDTNFSTSVIEQYKDTLKYGLNLDWPAGKLVEWRRTTTLDSIADIVVTVSEDRRFRESVTHTPDSKSDTCFVIRNMIPNRVYYYKVEEQLINGRARIVAGGRFRTEGQVRMIQVRGSHNVRDLGGWMTQYGVPVRYGKLYRSASLDACKATGRHDFRDNLNVWAELDLRAESKRKSSPLGEDVEYRLVAHEAGHKAITQKKSMYADDLRWIIAKLKEGISVDWHCAIGCDRCGTLSFLIEGLLGYDELSLGRDYELSSFAFKKIMRPRRPIGGYIKVIKEYGPANDLAQCFYQYWLSTGMTEDELDYFLGEMLDY